MKDEEPVNKTISQAEGAASAKCPEKERTGYVWEAEKKEERKSKVSKDKSGQRL